MGKGAEPCRNVEIGYLPGSRHVKTFISCCLYSVEPEHVCIWNGQVRKVKLDSKSRNSHSLYSIT